MLDNRPSIARALQEMGFKSILDMKENTLYTIVQGKIIETSLSNDGGLKTQSSGIGVPNIVEDVNGIIADRLDAYSKASISCLDFDPFDGIDARATVTHTIAVAGPNGRTFGPYTSATSTGYGHAATANKFMGGSTTALGEYAFSYLIEASCDGARTFGRGTSIWDIERGRASIIQRLILQPS